MSERWFQEAELAGQARARRWIARSRRSTPATRRRRERLCEEMKHEWLMLHDLMAESVLGLISFVQDELGDDGVAAAWTRLRREGAGTATTTRSTGLDRRQLVYLLAATWRAHSGQRRRSEHPGKFQIIEDDEKVTSCMNPCGSGAAAYAVASTSPRATARRNRAHDSSCAARTSRSTEPGSFMNEKLPIEWSGYPVYPSDPPEDFATGPCTWYWYKDPDQIPDRHYQRYGAVRPAH